MPKPIFGGFSHQCTLKSFFRLEQNLVYYLGNQIFGVPSVPDWYSTSRLYLWNDCSIYWFRIGWWCKGAQLCSTRQLCLDSLPSHTFQDGAVFHVQDHVSHLWEVPCIHNIKKSLYCTTYLIGRKKYASRLWKCIIFLQSWQRSPANTPWKLWMRPILTTMTSLK